MEKILVVDDEVEVCNVLKEFLSLKGYEVHTAFDGIHAIQEVKEFWPQTVFLDVKMPGMDGIEALREIKKIHPEARVIMVTAVADQETAAKAFELGAYDYIGKPLGLNYLERVALTKRDDGKDYME